MLNGFNGNITSIIDRLGRAVTVRTITNSGTAFDPVQTPSDAAARAAVFDYEASETDGSIVQQGDKEFILASTVPVTKQDKIVDGGKVYHIVTLEEVQPGDELLMYIAQGRE